VRDNLCEPVPEGTFSHLLDFVVQNEDAPTIQMDCHPIQTNWCPHFYHHHHFYTGCPSWHNPPNLSWLGTGTKYAGLHTRLAHRNWSGTSPPQSHLGRARRYPSRQRLDSTASFMCYKLRNTHCRQIQSLSHGYATSKQQCHMCPICYTTLAVLLP